MKKFTSFKEFIAGKNIVPMKIDYLCGTETNSKFRDKDGCVWRMTFKDEDDGSVERFYESTFDSFKEGAKGKKAGRKYFVKVIKNPNGHWEWSWTDKSSITPGGVVSGGV